MRMARPSVLRRVALVAALGSAGCSLLVSVDGLVGPGPGPPDAGAEARADGPDPIDAGPMDGGDVDAAIPLCPATVPADLTAYYTFNDGQGTKVTDCSAHALSGTIQNGTNGAWTVGKLGGALRVFSSNGCVDVGAHDELEVNGAFTVTAWIFIDAFPVTQSGGAGYIFGKTRDPDVSGWRLATTVVADGGGLSFSVAPPGADGGVGTRFQIEFNPIDRGRWMNVTARYTPGGRSELFIDGVLVKSQTGAPTTIVRDMTVPARIGCRGDGTNFFEGILDDVRLYNRALTNQEILNLAR